MSCKIELTYLYLLTNDLSFFRYYGLVPIASEDYSGYEASSYYAVAVARRTDSRLTIFNLKRELLSQNSINASSTCKLYIMCNTQAAHYYQKCYC